MSHASGLTVIGRALVRCPKWFRWAFVWTVAAPLSVLWAMGRAVPEGVRDVAITMSELDFQAAERMSKGDAR